MSKQKFLVSIVIPTYNDAPYLKKSIEDLLKQTYKNIEIIIVNDGSTDETEEILSKLASENNNIKIINKKNGGTGSALNCGFIEASGKYATWVSSDDRKEPFMIERLVCALEDNPTSEYAVSAYFSDGYKKIFRAFKPLQKNEGYITNFFSKQYEYNNGFFSEETSGQTFLIHKDDWMKINSIGCHSGVNYMFTMRLKNECGDFLEIPGEDYYMSVIMGSKSDTVYVDQVLGTHNSPPDSLSNMYAGITVQADILTKKYIQSYFTGVTL